MQESKLQTGESVLSKTCMVFGQMNEPPGARLRVALSALTMAEYFRDTQGLDILLSKGVLRPGETGFTELERIFRNEADAKPSQRSGKMRLHLQHQPQPVAEQLVRALRHWRAFHRRF